MSPFSTWPVQATQNFLPSLMKSSAPAVLPQKNKIKFVITASACQQISQGNREK
jgi:hypothetical protein